MEQADLTGWRTSTYSSNGGATCVEVGRAPDVVLVRDTQDRTGPVLRFTPQAWRGFAAAVKRSLAPAPDRGSRGRLPVSQRGPGPRRCCLVGRPGQAARGCRACWAVRAGLVRRPMSRAC